MPLAFSLLASFGPVGIGIGIGICYVLFEARAWKVGKSTEGKGVTRLKSVSLSDAKGGIYV